MRQTRSTGFAAACRAVLAFGFLVAIAAPAAAGDYLQVASTGACKEICHEYEDALSLVGTGPGQIKHFTRKVKAAEKALKDAKTDAEKAKAEKELAEQKDFLERAKKTYEDAKARVKASEAPCKKAIEAATPKPKTQTTNTCDLCEKEAKAYDKALNEFELAKAQRETAEECEASQLVEAHYDPLVKKLKAKLDSLSKALQKCEKKFCAKN